MEGIMDSLWTYILVGIQQIKHLLDWVFGPLNAAGPAFAILVIAFLAVAVAKLLSAKFKTKRYQELQKQFAHWYNIRQDALKCEDPEKARLLTKNIDQAKLNRVYYDYFFEGLMNSLATKYLPFFVLLAYVNETYQPRNLLKHFGRSYVFKFAGSQGKEIVVGAVFWFVVSIFLVYLVWYVAKKVGLRFYLRKRQPAGHTSQS
jgi:uncharacterized membrane protein (DUF106 family)